MGKFYDAMRQVVARNQALANRRARSPSASILGFGYQNIAIMHARRGGKSMGYRPGGGMEGFDGTEDLALGTVTGIRSWSVGHTVAAEPPNVRLGGVQGYQWLPGENIAVCGAGGVPSRSPAHFLGVPIIPGSELKADPAGHQVPVPECSCGFWAYWQLACVRCATTPVPYARSVYQCRNGWCHGVVEGYGRVVIGDNGFRSEKARLKALYVPPQIEDWYTRGLDANGITYEMRYDESKRRAYLAKCAGLNRYYGVPVYASVESMLTDHPPTTDYLPKDDDYDGLAW